MEVFIQEENKTLWSTPVINKFDLTWLKDREKRQMDRFPKEKWCHSDKKEPFFLIVRTKAWHSFLMYLWNFVDHLWHDCQATHKGASGHESPRQLDAELTRHIAKRLQLLRVPTHALHVGIAEFILNIDQSKHPLQEVSPEIRQHGLQVDGWTARHVVPCQGLEKVLEELGVLHVHHPVRSHKHVVQRDLCIFQKLTEKL